MEILEKLIEDRWTPSEEKPNNDRLVQIAYTDGSTSEKAIGFVDEVSRIPPTNKRIWWEWRKGSYPHPYEGIIAWREIPKGQS